MINKNNMIMTIFILSFVVLFTSCDNSLKDVDKIESINFCEEEAISRFHGTDINRTFEECERQTS